MRTLPGTDHGELWGRDRELVLAEAFLDDVGERERGFLLSGEPGIGKTAMWLAIVARAGERGQRVLACRCEKAEARLSFVGLSDLMAGIGSHVLASLPDVQRRALAAALLLEVPEGVGDPDPRTVATAFTSVIGELSRASRLLIAIDDIQWLDASTARVLSFAMRRLVDSPIGWLCTSRTPSGARDPLGLHRALAQRCTRVHLPSLSADALATLLVHQAEHSFTRPMLKRVVEASGGNPLFALEIASALAGPRNQLEDQVTIPANLRTLVSARVPRLQRGAREALLVAATASHPTRALIERASSATALAEAEETGLLEIEGERVRFRHPLYASAVYMSAATSRRDALHQRLAQLVADEEERARHLAMATRRPDSAVAMALDRGAAVARARGAWESAAGLLEEAQRLTPRQDAELRQRRAISAAEHHVHAGDRGRARVLLEDVLSDPTDETARADALRLLAQISYHDENYAEAQRLYEQALRVATDAALATNVELGLSYVHANRGDFALSTEFAYRALRRAEQLGDDGLLADALATSAMTDFLCGRGVHWTKVQDALQLEDRARLVPLHHRPSTIAATLTFYVGQLAEARQQLLELESWARDRGDESDVAWVATTLSWLETLSGNFQRATELADQSELVSRLTGSISGQAWALSQRAFVSAHVGDVERTRDDCSHALQLIERTEYVIPRVWLAAASGLLELSLGNAHAAWDACAAMTELVEPVGIAEPVTMFFVPVAIEARIGTGDLTRAETLLDMFEGRGRDLDRAWARATAARGRALLSAARGDLDAAVAALEDASVHHARVDMPFELARTLLVEGQIRRRRREKRLAHTALQRAAELFDGMGAPVWATRARSELARIGLRAAPEGLTATEQRVAELAASGMTARAIGTALFVSPKTVQANLARVYQKLGVHSRAELGAVMGRHNHRQTPD